MEEIREWVREHQLISFFVLTYTITWGLWIPFAGEASKEDSPLAIALAMWGVFGPGLAGILVTGIASPDRDAGRKVPLGAFLASLALATLMMLLNLLPSEGETWTSDQAIGSTALSLIAAIVPALIISAAFSRNQAMSHYVGSLVKPRGSAVYYLLALLLPFLMGWAGILLNQAFGGSAYFVPDRLGAGQAAILVPLLFVYQFIYGNAVGEEVGWRGFALPRLQARTSPLVASLIIALVWFPWHLPLKWANPDVIPYLPYALSFVPTSILLTWIYNRTRGSILAVGIAHVSSNIVGKLLFGFSDAKVVVGFALAIVLVTLDRMWERHEELPWRD